jgi:hypothetical protein
MATTPGHLEKLAAEQLELAIAKHADSYLPRATEQLCARYRFYLDVPRLEDIDAQVIQKVLETFDEATQTQFSTAWKPIGCTVKRAEDRAEGYTARIEVGLCTGQ